MTTAYGYLRLALFAFGYPSMSLDVDKIIVFDELSASWQACNEYALMFMRVHLKPRAVNGPGNTIFLR